MKLHVMHGVVKSIKATALKCDFDYRMTENKNMYVRCYFGGIVLTVGTVKYHLKHHLKEIFVSGMCRSV